jgi:hypothetical protein
MGAVRLSSAAAFTGGEAAGVAAHAGSQSAVAAGGGGAAAAAAGGGGKLAALHGDVATVTGLPGAGVHAVVGFEGGALGLVIDVRRDGSANVGLLRRSAIGGVASTPPLRVGTPAHLVSGPLSVPVGEALLGRVVDALGAPLDGGGAIDDGGGADAAAPPRRPALGGMPSLTRGRDFATRGQLYTGVKLLDALYPLAPGHSLAVIGERAAGKTRLGVEVVAGAAAHGASDGRPVRCVYVVIGASAPSLARITAALHRVPAVAAATVIVAAPAGSPLGAMFLAPFVGAAMAGYFRDAGEHALVVYDDLSTHYDAVRAMTEGGGSSSGGGGGGAGGAGSSSTHALTAPAMHGALLALCGAPCGGPGLGGSLSALALGESVPDAPTSNARPEDVIATRVVQALAAGADDTVTLSGALARDGGYLNMGFDALAAHGRHWYPVKALQTYGLRLQALVREVRGASWCARVCLSVGALARCGYVYDRGSACGAVSCMCPTARVSECIPACVCAPVRGGRCTPMAQEWFVLLYAFFALWVLSPAAAAYILLLFDGWFGWLAGANRSPRRSRPRHT